MNRFAEATNIGAKQKTPGSQSKASQPPLATRHRLMHCETTRLRDIADLICAAMATESNQA
jgi:hypothetical protein